MKATEIRQPKKSSGECDEVITATTASLSLSASPATAPARWAGRLSKLPVQLQQFLFPHAEPHLAKLQTGEIQKFGVFLPKIGSFTLECKGNEIYVTFLSTLFVAYQLLQMLRLRAIAIRYNTITKSPQGGFWVWLPKQVIFPPEFRVMLECVTLGLLQQRSPPLWRGKPRFNNDFEQINTLMHVSPAWVAPSVLSPSAPPALPRVAVNAARRQ